MSDRLAEAGAGARGILLDVEGTTTPIDFVTGVLFPFARAHVRHFLSRHAASSREVMADLAKLREERAADEARGERPPRWSDESPDATLDSAVATVEWLMDRNRKSTGLKSLQGRIWEEGYRSGALRGRVYPDVPPALERWHANGRAIAIFSSGSVLAQRLLFANSEAGDLTRFLGGYFDTTTGPKSDEASYGRISERLKLEPSKLLFVSDVAAELHAARSAGLRTLLCVRPGNSPEPAGHGHAIIRDFGEIDSAP